VQGYTHTCNLTLAMHRFTREDLAHYHGKNGSPAYIAFEGRVYDASRSFLWQRGRHQVRHAAGLDWTGGLDEAPHGADLLERFPVIGVLVDERTPGDAP
jgi:predicted heme/steroid binding protein